MHSRRMRTARLLSGGYIVPGGVCSLGVRSSGEGTWFGGICSSGGYIVPGRGYIVLGVHSFGGYIVPGRFVVSGGT